MKYKNQDDHSKKNSYERDTLRNTLNLKKKQVYTLTVATEQETKHTQIKKGITFKKYIIFLYTINY